MKNERNKLKEYLLNNIEVAKDLIIEINSWNSSLEHLEICENNEDFFDTFFTTPSEAVRAIYFGEFNFNDECVRFDGYGNIETLTMTKYEKEIKDNINEIIDRLEELHYDVYINDNVIEEYVEYIEQKMDN